MYVAYACHWSCRDPYSNKKPWTGADHFLESVGNLLNTNKPLINTNKPLINPSVEMLSLVGVAWHCSSPD